MSHYYANKRFYPFLSIMTVAFLGIFAMSGSTSRVYGTENNRQGGRVSNGGDRAALKSRGANSDSGGSDAAVDELFDELRLGKPVPLEGGPLDGFFKALSHMSRNKKGLVRVLHYGDSHTAADFLPSTIRRELQTRFGDGGRGFIYLGTPWRSFKPMDVEIADRGRWKTHRIYATKDPTEMDGRYGLGGVAIESAQRGAMVSMATSRGSHFGDKVSKFEIFYLKQPEGGSFVVSVDKESKGVVKTGSTRLKSGFFEVPVEEGPHYLRLQHIGKGKVRLFGAVSETKGPGVVYDAVGINGAFFYTSLRWDGTILKDQVKRRSPDLIVTMYGANESDARSLKEAAYIKKVRNSLAKLRSGAPRAACLMLGPTDRVINRDPVDGKQRLDLVIEVQRDIAEEAGCAFIDLRELMGGPNSLRKWREKGFAQPDGVHLTVLGYRILGEMIAEQILDSYDRYRQENGALIKRPPAKKMSDERSGRRKSHRRRK